MGYQSGEQRPYHLATDTEHLHHDAVAAQYERKGEWACYSGHTTGLVKQQGSLQTRSHTIGLATDHGHTTGLATDYGPHNSARYRPRATQQGSLQTRSHTTPQATQHHEPHNTFLLQHVIAISLIYMFALNPTLTQTPLPPPPPPPHPPILPGMQYPEDVKHFSDNCAS